MRSEPFAPNPRLFHDSRFGRLGLSRFRKYSKSVEEGHKDGLVKGEQKGRCTLNVEESSFLLAPAVVIHQLPNSSYAIPRLPPVALLPLLLATLLQLLRPRCRLESVSLVLCKSGFLYKTTSWSYPSECSCATSPTKSSKRLTQAEYEIAMAEYNRTVLGRPANIQADVRQERVDEDEDVDISEKGEEQGPVAGGSGVGLGRNLGFSGEDVKMEDSVASHVGEVGASDVVDLRGSSRVWDEGSDRRVVSDPKRKGKAREVEMGSAGRGSSYLRVGRSFLPCFLGSRNRFYSRSVSVVGPLNAPRCFSHAEKALQRLFGSSFPALLPGFPLPKSLPQPLIDVLWACYASSANLEFIINVTSEWDTVFRGYPPWPEWAKRGERCVLSLNRVFCLACQDRYATGKQPCPFKQVLRFLQFVLMGRISPIVAHRILHSPLVKDINIKSLFKLATENWEVLRWCLCRLHYYEQHPGELGFSSRGLGRVDTTVKQVSRCSTAAGPSRTFMPPIVASFPSMQSLRNLHTSVPVATSSSPVQSPHYSDAAVAPDPSVPAITLGPSPIGPGLSPNRHVNISRPSNAPVSHPPPPPSSLSSLHIVNARPIELLSCLPMPAEPEPCCESSFASANMDRILDFASNSGSDPPSQADLTEDIRDQLGGQTWQFPPDRLAKVLSAKTRRPAENGANPLDTHFSTIDSLQNYECAIDSDDHKDALKSAQQLFLKRKPSDYLLPNDKPETQHYGGLVKFLNAGLETCRESGLVTRDGEAIYGPLMFWVWDKLVGDKVDGAHPVAPGIAGALGTEEPKKLFWSPKLGEKGMKVPVEVKNDWPKLVAQAGTYARALFSANPLRQFVLVLGYNHAQSMMRFLVFHRGGLTASAPLLLGTEAGQNEFIHLLSAILTWKTPQDAGFPAWCNENQIFLPKIHESPINIARILHHTSCVRGRAPRVYHLRIPHPSDSKPAEHANVPPRDQYVAADTRILRRSPRNHPSTQQATINSKSARVKRDQQKSLPSEVPQAGAVSSIEQGNEEGRALQEIHPALAARFARLTVGGRRSLQENLLEMNTDVLPAESGVEGLSTDDVQPIQISRIVASGQYAPSATTSQAPVEWNKCEGDGLKPGDYAVLKMSWNPARGPDHKPVEPKLLKQCSGMFGVPHHYYSFLAHHQDSYPTTNHLFLPSGVTDKNLHWNVFRAKADSVNNPDRRSLLGHVIAHAGHSLVTAKDFPSLMCAIVHAHLGYYNMCQKNFQHRDISIGNVLMVDEPIKTKPFQIARPNETQKEILDLCKKLNISDNCVGFVIDGDMAVDWTSYFDESHTAGKSGTEPFMSTALLRPLKDPQDNRLHSPLDDYLSFFYVAQWACIFNPSADKLPLVQELRTEIDSGYLARNNVVFETIRPKVPMRSNQYGAFLEEAQPLLRAWWTAMDELAYETDLIIQKSGNNIESFRGIANIGLKLFLEVVCQHCPDGW
ncbi:hypothetical protein D9757_010237 [Collybiopsis confluens]|uniref:Fungal-type protein kinase domain-containing protein n=1 Tax=Collybiopsis confluens TaxID=2823264 RepID=A0A8H5HB45_9AGAR|nr:hypothetical protein D9757_010237 [Collybiopsis confluens]